MDLPLSTLQTIRTVAECRSFTAAATGLGYTQSAVSRQIAAAERDLGVALFERVPRGVQLTRAGGLVLRQVVIALDALEQAERMLAGKPRQVRRVRVGVVSVAGAALLPRSIAALRQLEPDLEISTREGATPALVRGVRAGTLDVALITGRPPFRSPDQEHPPLEQHTVTETALALAVPSASRHAGPEPVTLESLEGESWIASRSSEGEPLLGVWPGLPGRPVVQHWTRDWAAKLGLVAQGAGITTVPAEFLPAVPPGVTITQIHGVPAEIRRVMLAHARDLDQAVVALLVRAMREAAATLVTEHREWA
ncbi:LysR family transcriptional regulator [Streptomyces sp. NBC_00859]|uniref:LysR family transcriptional regulator n=1 Tax=Streptomyces sp. NBC_00859 TaxID=2903682 RepID=UPI00386DDE50|nr:LysR family transcriptional regulator [Streptomyces sp. NBC_00859]